MDKKSKSRIAAGQGHPPFSDDRIDAEIAPTSEVDHLPEGFTHKLFATKAAMADDSDPRVAQALRVHQYAVNSRKSSDEFRDAKEGRLVKDLKRDKGSDCGAWHGGVTRDGTHNTKDTHNE
jgi:hypothetical protein